MFKVFENILGLFFLLILNFHYLKNFISVPKISFFFVSIYICENSYILPSLSSILTYPTDLKI